MWSRVKGRKRISEVTMTFRVVDAISGLVVYTETVRADNSAWKLDIAASGKSLDGATQISSQEPITYALTACIQKAVYSLALWLREQPWTGSVAGVEKGGRILINAGRNLNLRMGMTMAVLKNMGEIVDPNTELSLGIRAETIGSVEIMSVDDAFSVAVVQRGCEGVQVGDRVKFVRTSRAGPSAGGSPGGT
ncbi:MAG: CsgG/HfaB family protein, partial [Acidobacteriota bacterium]